MPASNGKDTLEPLSQTNCAPAALKVSADADDRGDARMLRPFDYLRQVGREVRIIEMSVGIVELHLTRSFSLGIRIFALACIHTLTLYFARQ
jgi:hypothetical protein